MLAFLVLGPPPLLPQTSQWISIIISPRIFLTHMHIIYGSNGLKPVIHLKQKCQKKQRHMPNCRCSSGLSLHVSPERDRVGKSKWWYASGGLWGALSSKMIQVLCDQSLLCWEWNDLMCKIYLCCVVAPGRALRGRECRVSSAATAGTPPINTPSRSAFQRSRSAGLLLAIAIWAPPRED